MRTGELLAPPAAVPSQLPAVGRQTHPSSECLEVAAAPAAAAAAAAAAAVEALEPAHWQMI